MKSILLIAILMLAIGISAYEVDSYDKVFIDSSRNNREINTKIYYPISEDKASGRLDSFPKLIFGHGWLMTPASYSQLSQFFASQGFIVALPYTESGFYPSHSEFALDLIFLVSALDGEGENDNSPLYQTVANQSIVSGHSMGGGVSVLAASQSNIFSALVNFAAAETSPSAIDNASDIYVPSLIFSASNDNITPENSNQIPIYQNISADYKSIVSLLGENHLGITDNNLAYNLAKAFIDYALTGDSNDQADFENLLSDYQNSGQIEYNLTNNVSAFDQDTLHPCQIKLINYPNPFNPNTNISFELDRNYPDLQLQIYNLKGQLVNSFMIDARKSDNHNIHWDGKDKRGVEVASGIYLYLLKTKERELARRKMIMLK